METKISLGKSQNSGQIKHITEVENGLNCNCVCIDCNKNLIAANRGKIQQPHFRHEHESECLGGAETALHLLAKQIISEGNSIKISGEITFLYDHVETEKVIEDFIPDLILSRHSNKKWLIEIAVTHFIDESKKKKIRTANLNCIEIDLRNIDRHIEPNKLRDLLLTKSSNKTVINQTKDSNKKYDNYGCLIAMIIGILAFLKFNWINKKS